MPDWLHPWYLFALLSDWFSLGGVIVAIGAATASVRSPRKWWRFVAVVVVVAMLVATVMSVPGNAVPVEFDFVLGAVIDVALAGIVTLIVGLVAQVAVRLDAIGVLRVAACLLADFLLSRLIDLVLALAYGPPVAML